MSSTPRNPWIAHTRPNREGRLRLFCFPYAGGSAAIYRSWADRLPPEVEVLPVELPGRASRFREPLCQSVAEVVVQASVGLAPLFDRPLAFFGHSMGAVIAFEMARQLRREGRAAPVWLFVSGRRAPHLNEREDPMHALPDDEFLLRLRDLNGTPEEALQHPELMQMMQPMLRADFAVVETYRIQPEAPLSCPLSVLGGLADPEVTRDDLAAWAQHSTGPFSQRMFEGDHFFLNKVQPQLLQAVAQDLYSALGSL